jgi:hypothetical protein
MSAVYFNTHYTPAKLVEFADRNGSCNYELRNLSGIFSHKDNIVNIHVSNKRGCAVKLDFVPTRVERCMDTPRAATDGKIYALIESDGITYFDDLVELVENHDTEFTRLLLLEAKFEALIEQVYWMPGGPGYSMAKESYEEHANTSAKKE